VYELGTLYRLQPVGQAELQQQGTRSIIREPPAEARLHMQLNYSGWPHSHLFIIQSGLTSRLPWMASQAAELPRVASQLAELPAVASQPPI
jgi:hypothetical protein